MQELRRKININGEDFLLAVSQHGEGPPVIGTLGKPGVLYLDTEASPERLYICTAANVEAGVYTWRPIEELLKITVSGDTTVVPGDDGITPHIGENGNWYLGDTDTGVRAAGADGENGGYYSPEITPNEADNSFTITFKASKSGMPAVAPATIKLPEKSNDSGQNDNKIPTSADLNGTTATFRNSAGIALFTLDLSGLGGGSAAVYGNLVLSAEALTITEGQSGMFTVALDQAPSANQPVYLAVSDGSRLSVSPATLTFTPENWETPQTVTVTSLEDDDEEDNAITVTLTSTAVDARQVAVAIRDNDVQLEIVTDGLVLNMDYTGHVGDESDTITDLASGVTFKNFSHFEKQATGITGNGTYKYLSVVDDDAKTAFVEKVKATGAFSVEAFGTCLLPSFFAPNYKSVLGTGNAGGWPSTNDIPTTAGTNATRILTDGSTSAGSIGGDDFIYTINGISKPMNNGSIKRYFPYITEFKHMVITFAADGYVDIFVNGVKNDAPVAAENFQAWDFDTMFGGDWSLLNNADGTGVTTIQRIYNRVLTAEEVTQNMRANAKLLGLETF